jgi:uncharacterized protein YpmS
MINAKKLLLPIINNEVFIESKDTYELLSFVLMSSSQRKVNISLKKVRKDNGITIFH